MCGEKDSHAVPKSFFKEDICSHGATISVVSYLLFSSNKDENSCLFFRERFNLMGSLIFSSEEKVNN